VPFKKPITVEVWASEIDVRVRYKDNNIDNRLMVDGLSETSLWWERKTKFGHEKLRRKVKGYQRFNHIRRGPLFRPET
jgi:hypothetical protein